MDNKCNCGTGHFGYHEVSCAVHKGYAPDHPEPPSLSDTECKNEKVPHLECVEQCDKFKINCYVCGEKDAKAELQALRDKIKECRKKNPLSKSIKELEMLINKGLARK